MADELMAITREEEYLDAIANGKTVNLEPITRKEIYLHSIANGTKIPSDMRPITRNEILLDAIAEGKKSNLVPITREEMYLESIANGTDLPSDLTPITREEIFLQKIIDNGGGKTEEGLVYKNDGDIVLNGSTLIDTGFAPNGNSLTIMCKWRSWNIYNGSTLFSLRSSATGANATALRWMIANSTTYVGYSMGYSNVIQDFAGDSVVVSMKPNAKPVWYYKTKSNSLKKVTTSNNPSTLASNVWIGGLIKSNDGSSSENRATATITEFKCYNIVCDEEKIKDFLGI